ncbi:valine--tRNA ligase [Candidatus Dependentiae bacterium]
MDIEKEMDKKYESKIAEHQMQSKWEKENTYAASNNPGPTYSIDTPPPTVSGSLHIGHIFSYTQTDIIARYKRMSGYSVFYPFGFDDNGLPTGKYVEKKLKISSHKMGRQEFTKKCLEVSHEVEEEFKNLWQQMGLSVDWSICYSTIEDNVRKLSQESFIQLYHKGFLYRKEEPALFCTTCGTSVAQAELDDEQKESYFNDIVFKTEDGKELLIATTRPEMLPSCVAVLYNPDDERYKHLKNKKVIVPIFGHSVEILEDDQVEIEKGTGLVMVCTFGDTTDTVWFKKFNLPYKQSLNFWGKFLPEVPIIGGLKVKDARKKIIEELEMQGLLINKKSISHSVNVHERCKKEIEILALPQWFLKILEHKKKLLELAKKIEWHPSFMKSRYIDWVENIGWDWCLSRQRFFGIPFPVWYCQDCGQVLLADIKDLPIDPQETDYPGGKCTKCKSTDIKPDTDVMDTWNTSSITPYILYTYFNPDGVSPFEKNKVSDFIPMSMRAQAHDIIRTWAFYTMVKTWMHHKTIPWNNIVISGHVLADTKGKISKSKGGGPLAPQTLLQNASADAIRYWTASGGLGKDISFSESQIKIGKKLVTKLWNAFRFIKTHITDISGQSQQKQKLGIVNEWILDEATKCFENYTRNFQSYEFGIALQQIDKFFWSEFCDNYLELIKDQLFNPENYDEQLVQATKHTLYSVGLRILQMYANYVPHVTEYIYQIIYKEKDGISSLHQTKFETVQTRLFFSESSRRMGYIIDVISQVRQLKTKNELSLKTDIDNLEIYSLDQEALQTFRNNEQLIRGITKSHLIEFKNEKLKQSNLDKIGDRLKAVIKIENEK